MRRKWVFSGIAVVLLSATVSVLRVSAGSDVEVAPMEVLSSGNDGRLVLMIPLAMSGTLKPVEVDEKKDRVTLSIQIHKPFTPFWNASAHLNALDMERRVVELTTPLGDRALVNTDGEPIPVDRLPAGCGIPDPAGSDSRPAALGTKELRRTRSIIKIAFIDHRKRAIDHVEVIECSDRVYVSAVPGSKRAPRKIQIVAVRLSFPLGERKVMDMRSNPITAR
ncbi:hypothetical protein [Actinocorallia libanotica]